MLEVMTSTAMIVHFLLMAPAADHAAPRPQPHSVEIGIASGAIIPAGTPSNVERAGDTGLSVVARLAYLPWTFLGAEAEGIHIASRTGEQDGGYAFRAHLLGQIPGRLSPFVLVGGGLNGRPSPSDDELRASVHWGWGARWWTHRSLNLRLEGRHIVTGGPQGARHDVEMTLGIGFTLFAQRPSRPRHVVRESANRSIAMR